ncbi:nucleotidyltransferase family protein, partial [Thomasclavelia cocleata]|uniref:nucleotidyltransferase family protein n=1 Tax=Thomasclavelia cocleata TaxID=69824 RepID=UPI0026159459
KSLNYGIKDIDIIYFDKNDLSVEKDIQYFEKIKDYSDSKGFNYEIDVSNEARMHLWKKEKNNVDIEPYLNSEDAIDKWIATIHAIGITKENNNIKIYAPYGLSDIFSRTIRPIKHNGNSKELYDKKANSWKERFNNLTIVEW